MPMFETSIDAIRTLLVQGESEHVEFKMRLPPEQDIARYLAAFANSQGGILLVGVGPNGEKVGLTEVEYKHAIQVLRTTAMSLLPSPVNIGSVTIDGKQVVFVAVEPLPPSLRPVLIASGEAYIRQGMSTRRVDISDLISPGGSSILVEAEAKSQYRVFVAMSFRTEEEPALVDYYEAIKRAADRCELPITLRRVDLEEGDYEISKKIMDEIDAADIVIADFTLSPANVYFEIGYARGRQKRIIQTARKGTALEFDIRNWRTAFYRNATELEATLISALQAAYSEVAPRTHE